MTHEERGTFNTERAEMFEALGHPVRIKILQALEEKPMGFAELKRSVGIESSGHLSFHLGKLTELVNGGQDGTYALTDDGREALRIFTAVESGTKENTRKTIGRLPDTDWAKALLAGLTVALIVLGSVAVYQQQQIAALSHELDTGTVVIGGNRYWDASYPVLVPNGTSISFHGVLFTYLQPLLQETTLHNYTYYGSIRLSNGSTIELRGESVLIEENGVFTKLLRRDNATGVIYGTSLSGAIMITFPNGKTEIFNNFDTTAKPEPPTLSLPREHILLIITYHAPVVNPWFTQGKNPQAGVFWNYTSGTFTFYVRVP